MEQILKFEPELLDEYLPSEEWEEIRDADIEANTALKEEIWHGINKRTRKGKVYSLFIKSAAIAASVMLLIAAIFYLNPSGEKPLKEIAQHTVDPDSLQLAQNSSNNIKTIKLADGSEVTLYPHSSIKYSLNFKSNRTIQLIAGKAAFDVAKDPGHPFTVLSGTVATTALGTKFIVHQQDNKVNVRLYEGKVVVKSLAAGTAIQPAFLTPGEQCIINVKMNEVAIGSIKNETFEDVLQITKDIPVQNLAGSGISIKFYNTPLPEVFERLKTLSGKPIVYNAKEMDRMFFTGQFSSGDSIAFILRTLTSTNGFRADTERGIIKITQLTTSTLPGNSTETNVQSKNGQIKNDQPVANKSKSIKTGALTYASAPLEQVFHEMEHKFQIQIIFQAADIKGKYFTGTITSQDDPHKLLSVICGMNQLRMVRQSNGYQVMK
ncbi:FecR domain-containing protein [Niabella sp. 22666]|uniref:FecR domain-containing protein n=1 Tax=Niabella sp. 22666 TaxID=3453954 RepID=UPI003F872F91